MAQLSGKLGGGGVQRLAYNLAMALVGTGTRSLAVAVREGDGPVCGEQSGGVELVGLGAGGGLLSRLKAGVRLRRLVKRGGIQIVHVHGQATLPFCAAALIGLRQRPKMLFTWHNSEEVLTERGMRRKLLLWALRRCDGVTGSSQDVVRQLAETLHPRNGVHVFKNGVPEGPATSGIDSDEPVIVWLARLVPPKDPQILIRAAAKLKSEGLRFRVVLAGSAPKHLEWFAEQTRALIGEMGVEDVVSMPGWIADSAELIRTAAIGVQTSHTEGLSLALLEQLMAGLAVVATDVGDSATAVENEKTGLLIRPKDEDMLIVALRRLIQDKAMRQRLGRSAREKAMAEFSLKAMAQRAAAEYRGVAA